jgi:hypothetical protein
MTAPKNWTIGTYELIIGANLVVSGQKKMGERSV